MLILIKHLLKAGITHTPSCITYKGKKTHCQTTGSSAPTFALKVYFKALMHLLLIPAFPAFF